MADNVIGLLVFVKNTVDPLACSVKKADSLLDRSSKTLDIGDERGCSGLGVLCAGDGLESASVGVTIEDLVRDLDEEAAVGSTLSVDSNGSADVASRLNILARLGRDGHVNSGVGESAGVRAAEEVLDEGAEAVELVRSGVPAEQGLATVGLEGQGKHVFLVLDIDLDLVLLLGVGDGKA